MKKFKFLTLVLFIALMTTGVGYACYSYSFTLNNTVPTREVSVRFEKGELAGLRFSDFKSSEYISNTGIKIGNDNNILTDNNIATIKFTNMYPGSWVAFRLKAINSGTVPIKVSDVNIGKFCGDSKLLKYLSFEAGIGIDSDGDKIIDKQTSFKGHLKDIESMFNRALNSGSIKNTQIKPGGGIYFYIPEGEIAPDLDNDNVVDRFIVVRLDQNAPNSTENRTFNFKLTVNFKQFNRK